MTNPVQEAPRLGQSIWYDNIRRGHLTSGELARLIELGITGATFNPSIFEKVIAGNADYDLALLKLAQRGKTTGDALEALMVEEVRAAADLLRPVFDRTEGHDGYASLEVNPHLAHDSGGTVAEARRLFGLVEGRCRIQE